jgi:hypothetical protein
MGTLTEKLLECYPHPAGGMLREMERIEEGIRPEDKDRIFEAILEDAGARVTVKDIRLACGRLGISYKSATHIKPRDHTCDCCGKTFKYIPCSNDNLRLNYEQHDFCPNCGFQVCWTIWFHEELRHGKESKGYAKLLDTFASSEGYGSDKKKGVFYSRAIVSREAAIDKQALIDAQVRLDALLMGKRPNVQPSKNGMREMIEEGRK